METGHRPVALPSHHITLGVVAAITVVLHCPRWYYTWKAVGLLLMDAADRKGARRHMHFLKPCFWLS